jgi:death-on-curing protein
MALHRRVAKVGGSLGILIPRDLADVMGVKEGTPVRLSLVGRQMVVEPVVRDGPSPLRPGLQGTRRVRSGDGGHDSRSASPPSETRLIGEVRFLSSDQVVAMHAELLRRWGGAEGGGHRGAEFEGVEAAVQAVKNSYYESREELADIVQGHVFMDGNKRTGAAATLTFLLANGGRTRRSSKEVFQAMLDLQERAERGERTDQLVAWLAGWLSR